MRMDKKNYPQVYLEECKCKRKKAHLPRFINTELDSESDSESDDDSENDSNNDSDNDSDK